jgi:hypothetical protein
VGYLLAVEWVGRLLVSVVSEPFFVGSGAHAAAVARLPDADSSRDFVDVDVDGVGVAVWPDAPSRAAVIWRVEAPAAEKMGNDACFFKILRGPDLGAAHFRRIAETYAAYAGALAEARDARPAALLDASLLFGAGEVCVLMPWARGRDATIDDLREGGVAVAPVAEAVVWLARRGLLYVDLREPNVRVDGAGRVALIDYDDMVVVAPPASAADLRELLQLHDAAWAGRPGEAGARPAVVNALAAAWL